MSVAYGKVIGMGGTVTRFIDSGYVYFVHTFLRSSQFTINQNIDVDYLIVGGGGGSSTTDSGGGGGGGVLTGSTIGLSRGVFPIVVGAGGSAHLYSPNNACKGGDSSFNNLTAYGGGYGAYYTVQAASGGSGGGCAHSCCGLVRASGTAGQGYGGGFGNWTRGYGGGGGAGGAGQDGTNLKAGDGGVGLQSSITGTATYYGGGGAGGTNGYGNVVTSGTGGLGGGGNSGVNGTNGLGGGAGGRGGGLGGSGVVIVRYRVLIPSY